MSDIIKLKVINKHNQERYKILDVYQTRTE